MRVMIACVLFLLFLCSCDQAANQQTNQGGTSSEGAKATDRPVIALVMKTLTNPFFVEMERGARRAEKEFKIDLIVKTAAQETSIEQQISIIEQLIRQHVSAIVIAPGDSSMLIPILRSAQEKGIIIVNIDNRLDPILSERNGLARVPYVSVDNQKGAYMSAKVIADQVSEPGVAVIIEGIRTAANAQARKQGALNAFRENKMIISVISESANWKIDEAYHVTNALLDKHSDIRVIFAANDMMGFGVVKALTEHHLPNVTVASFDNLEETRAAILNGEIAATIDQRAADQGYLGVHYAVDLLNGQTPPLETLVDVMLVTKPAM